MPGARILVVDDEPAIRLLCRVNLQAEGFAVEEARGRRRGDGASRASGIPTLMLLDVMMPGEDGFAVAERIRDDPELDGRARAVPHGARRHRRHERVAQHRRRRRT